MKELIDQIIAKTKELEALKHDLYHQCGVEFCAGYHVDEFDNVSFHVYRGINELAKELEISTKDVIDYTTLQREFVYDDVKFFQLAQFREAQVPKENEYENG